MELQDKRRRLRLLIVASTAFGCSIAALSGTLAALTYNADMMKPVIEARFL